MIVGGGRWLGMWSAACNGLGRAAPAERGAARCSPTLRRLTLALPGRSSSLRPPSAFRLFGTVTIHAARASAAAAVARTSRALIRSRKAATIKPNCSSFVQHKSSVSLVPSLLILLAVGAASGYTFSTIARVGDAVGASTYRETWLKIYGEKTVFLADATIIFMTAAGHLHPLQLLPAPSSLLTRTLTLASP